MRRGKDRDMKQIRLPAVLVLFSAMFVSGCAMTPGGIADSTTPIGNREYRIMGRAVENDSRFYLLGLIPITGPNTTRGAIDKCIKSREGDAMINVTVDAYSSYWILFSKFSTRVEGEVIRFE